MLTFHHNLFDAEGFSAFGAAPFWKLAQLTLQDTALSDEHLAVLVGN
jgi:hypothetical protein